MTARIFVIAAAGMLAFSSTPSFANDVNPVVGKVGEFSLTEADLERLISYQPEEVQKRLNDDPARRVELVREMLLTKAVAARARKEGLDRKPEMKEQLGYMIEDYLARQYLLKVVLATVTVPEDDVKKFYQDNLKEFTLPERAKVRHIFIEAPGNAASEARAKARARAEEALQRLKKGEEFATVAREVSQDSETAAKGGDLGYLSPGGSNSPEFEKVALGLKPGEIGPVVETPFGYHIIKVDERQEKSPVRFEEVRDQIRKNLKTQLEQKKAREFLDRLATEAGLQVIGEKPAGSRDK